MDHSTIWIGWILFVSGTFVPFFGGWKGREGSIPLQSRMQCTKDACTVVQFYLFLLFLFFPFDQSCEIEELLVVDVI